MMAINYFEEVGTPFDTAYAAYEHAMGLKDKGDTKGARVLLEKAKGIFSGMGARIYLERCKKELEGLGVKKGAALPAKAKPKKGKK